MYFASELFKYFLMILIHETQVEFLSIFKSLSIQISSYIYIDWLIANVLMNVLHTLI